MKYKSSVIRIGKIFPINKFNYRTSSDITVITLAEQMCKNWKLDL